MTILLSFSYAHVVPNLYSVLSSVEYKRRYFEKCLTLNVNGLLFRTPLTFVCIKKKNVLQTHIHLVFYEIKNVNFCDYLM